MSLNWNFKTDKIGTWEETGYNGNKITFNLYSGNALLIALYETDDTYSLQNFYCDKDHMKNCLGLTKGYENIHKDVIDLILTLRADYRYTKDIVSAFAKADFNNEITIKILPKTPF